MILTRIYLFRIASIIYKRQPMQSNIFYEGAYKCKDIGTYNAFRAQEKYFSCTIAKKFILLLVTLVFFVISGVSSNVRNLTSLPQNGGSRILLRITGMHSGCLGVKCFLCNRPCRREIISTALLRRLTDKRNVWTLFFLFPSPFFPPRSAPRLTRLDSEVDEGEGLETRVRKGVLES